MAQTLLPGSVLAMTDQAADRLLRLDSGDAALLYLYLLRTGDWRSTIALALIFPAMLWAHRSNFARWREGKEQTFRQFLFGRHEPQREEAGE